MTRLKIGVKSEITVPPKGRVHKNERTLGYILEDELALAIAGYAPLRARANENKITYSNNYLNNYPT